MTLRGRARIIFLAQFLILLACGVLAGRVCLWFGFPFLAERNAVAILCSYLCFLLMMWVYGEAVHDHPDLLAGAETSADDFTRTRKSAWMDWLTVDGVGDSAEAAGCLVIVACVALLVLVGIWIGIEGPELLIDEAFAAGLSAGLAGKGGLTPDRSWFRRVVLRTLWPVVIYLIFSTIIMMYADVKCPGRPGLSAVLRECVLTKW